jgi:hypothetical protein
MPRSLNNKRNLLQQMEQLSQTKQIKQISLPIQNFKNISLLKIQNILLSNLIIIGLISSLSKASLGKNKNNHLAMKGN